MSSKEWFLIALGMGIGLVFGLELARRAYRETARLMTGALDILSDRLGWEDEDEQHD